MAASGVKIPYVFREMVTKVMRIFLASPLAHSESVCQKTGTDFISKSEIKKMCGLKAAHRFYTQIQRAAAAAQHRIDSEIPTLRPRYTILYTRAVIRIGLRPTITRMMII